MIIYLRYKPDKIVNRVEYMNTYASSSGYKMLQGSPIIVNVDGLYIKATDIPELIINRKYAKLVSDWVSELRNPPLEVVGTSFYLKWRK